jgi:hypothetical protein
MLASARLTAGRGCRRGTHQRLEIVMHHLHKTGRSLNTAVSAYKALAGSLDGKVLPRTFAS